MAAHPAAGAVAAEPQPAQVLGDHTEGAWLEVAGGQQEHGLVVGVAGPGQLEQPVVGDEAAFAGDDGQGRAAEHVAEHAVDQA